VGDFNGDGKLDLAVLSSDGYGYFYANVLLGNGDGTFSGPSATQLTGSNYNSVAVADFNGDGKLDFATANYDLGTVSMLLGDGLGNLQPPTEFSVGPYLPSSVVAGDVNGDGKIDLVTTSSITKYGINANTVSVLLGDGLGGFGAAQNYAVGANPSPVVLGDFNRDGRVDLLLTTSTDSNPVVSVLVDTGGGAFSAPHSYYGGYDPGAVAAGDFNGDGWLDAAAVNSVAAVNSSAGSVSVLINDTSWSATSAPATSFAVSGFPSSTTAGVAGAFTVTAEDAGGATATAYAGTVHFTSSDPQAVLPAAYTFTASDQGMHTFSATLKTAGAQSLTVTDRTSGSLTGTETGITVSPAAASKFIISAPASVSAGVAFSLTLTVEDAYGNVVTGYTGTVQFGSTDGRAKLPKDYTFTAADKGVHTFTGLVLRTKGNQKITITDTLNSSLTASVIENVP
jgi:hypothetical protein